MHTTRLALALALLAAPLSAQQFSPYRSVSARSVLEDELYGDPISEVDEERLDTPADGWWSAQVSADAPLSGSVAYCDAGQASDVDASAGEFEVDGFAAGGLYSQLNGDVACESRFQADFQVATSATVSVTYEFWFGDTFDGLTSHDRPGQATAEVRVEDAAGNVVWADTATYDDGGWDDFAVVALGPGTYRFVARAEVVDSTFYETVYGSQTLAGFYAQGEITGGAPVDLIAPAVPTGLAAAAGDAAVDLVWDANAEPDLAGYEVRRATAFGGPYTALGTTAATSFADTTAANGTTYWYAVAAYDLAGNVSDPSAPVSARPEEPPPPGPQSVHVASIDVVLVHVQGPRYRAVATVRIVDDLGNPVQGATVSGDFGGSYSGSATATTDASGDAVLQSGPKKHPTSATLCVTDVAAALPWEPADDVETCDGA